MTNLLEEARRRDDEWIRIIATMVDTDSGPDDHVGISAVYDIVDAELRSIGFTGERRTTDGPPVLVAHRPSTRDDAQHILIIGHADTVFGKGTPHERPFKAAGDRLTGPGVADMKSGIAVAIGALQLVDERTLDALEITVLINGDEESGSAHSRETILDVARDANAALVFEAGRQPNRIVRSRRGAHRFEVAVTGRAAHTGVNPEDGANAIEAIAHHILAIQELGRSIEGATVNAVMLSGGTRPNIIPDRATLRVDSRFDSDDVEEAVIAGIRSLAGEGPVAGTTTVVRSLDRRPAFREAAEELIAEYSAAASRLGFDVEAAATGGSSDGNFTSSIGVPTIDGLGAVGDGFHTADEFVVASSVAERVAVFAALLEQLADEGR